MLSVRHTPSKPGQPLLGEHMLDHDLQTVGHLEPRYGIGNQRPGLRRRAIGIASDQFDMGSPAGLPMADALYNLGSQRMVV
jgi:hypothetical protein